mmetsp:Transcript_86725/g.250284  ORF Transcript_86725/g.250284 Transcript_86725/m.250284 type:complete len:333 (-) Transcript_86725:384-1382(-)
MPLVQVRWSLRVLQVAELAGAAVGAVALREEEARPRAELRVADAPGVAARQVPQVLVKDPCRQHPACNLISTIARCALGLGPRRAAGRHGLGCFRQVQFPPNLLGRERLRCRLHRLRRGLSRLRRRGGGRLLLLRLASASLHPQQYLRDDLVGDGAAHEGVVRLHSRHGLLHGLQGGEAGGALGLRGDGRQLLPGYIPRHHNLGAVQHLRHFRLLRQPLHGCVQLSSCMLFGLDDGSPHAVPRDLLDLRWNGSHLLQNVLVRGGRTLLHDSVNGAPNRFLCHLHIGLHRIAHDSRDDLQVADGAFNADFMCVLVPDDIRDDRDLILHLGNQR